MPRFQEDEASGIAIARLGLTDRLSQYDEIHALIPRDVDAASKNTYSGNFGYGKFPFHTDFAHWFVPPRYLVLRCVVGATQVATLVADSRPLIQKYGEGEMSRALVRARTPIKGHRPLLHLFEAERGIFRWDSLFLAPASPLGASLFESIGFELTKFDTDEVVLSKPGDTLVIDNWRCLHGRSAVPKRQRDRKIDRAYLSSFHK